MIKPIPATGLESLELKRLRDGVARLFSALQEAIEAENPESGTWAPSVDVCETIDAILVQVEVAGVSSDQIKVGLNNTQLRVCGDKKRRGRSNRTTSYLCSERSYGRFSRIVPLRWTINVRAATAELAGGVLTIRLPKIEDRRGVEVNVVVKEVVGK